jgi:hypothetical protein
MALLRKVSDSSVPPIMPQVGDASAPGVRAMNIIPPGYEAWYANTVQGGRAFIRHHLRRGLTPGVIREMHDVLMVAEAEERPGHYGELFKELMRRAFDEAEQLEMTVRAGCTPPGRHLIHSGHGRHAKIHGLSIGGWPVTFFRSAWKSWRGWMERSADRDNNR